ncbi:MAG: tRNA 2-thiouridine(34) synthase MnmA [Gammaproteobacteria bacterium]
MVTRAEKIMVALSGGVDSAVTALLLKQQGYAVEALHMTNWEDDEAYCTAARDFQDARAVCQELDIPLHRVNFSQAYREQVFADFLREYAAGRTPNPDVLCNREIKFGLFLDYAQRLGASRMATGHYARVTSHPTRLLRGRDTGKDQSYFLHAVAGTALAHCLFPLGELDKAQVRELATRSGLPVNNKRDSTGICFIGERPFREFLQGYLQAPEGRMLTPDGEDMGAHVGLMFYTRGQRQGLGIGGSAGHTTDAWYVAGKDIRRNVLTVVQGREHSALWDSTLVTGQPSWVAGEPAALINQGSLACTAKTRYRQQDAPCRVVRRADAGLAVEFEQPQWAVTPGQYAVFYQDDECLGGAVIERTGAESAQTPDQLAASA